MIACPRGVALVGVLLLASASARADETVDAARASYERGDLDDALSIVDTALSGSGLSRQDLVGAYVVRALVQRAQGSTDALTETLRDLAALGADIELPPEVPPSLRDRIGALRDEAPPIGFEATLERLQSGDVRLTTQVTGDRRGLVRGRLLSCRAGDGPPIEHDGVTLLVETESSEPVRCEARLLGPGGAPLAERGTGDDPLVAPPAVEPDMPAVTAPDDTSTSSPPILRAPEQPPHAEDSGVPAWPFIAGGALVAVGVGVLLAVLLANPSVDTIIEPPTFRSSP